MMEPDLLLLYENMFRSRLFEEAVTRIWLAGDISGEMHLSVGEEAIFAGTVLQLVDGDAMALDHRGTAPMVMRGIDLVLLLKEFLGRPDGLCGGKGGHMHLFSKEHLIASSGIVGAAGPAAVGFALAATYLRPKKIALAFFGEGAMNQGMLMEAMNLAVAWNLPVIFVCKDSKWAITTISSTVTGGNLTDRARSFGMPASEIDGTDVETVWSVASEAIQRARDNKGPSFILAHCMHPEGHFLGDPLLRITRRPLKEMSKISIPLIKSITKMKGSSISERTSSLGTVTTLIGKTIKEHTFDQKDPLNILKEKLKSNKDKIEEIENKLREEIQNVVHESMQPENTSI